MQGSWGGGCLSHDPLKLDAVLHKGRGTRVGGFDLGGASLIVEKCDSVTFLEGTHVIRFTPCVSGKLGLRCHWFSMIWWEGEAPLLLISLKGICDLRKADSTW